MNFWSPENQVVAIYICNTGSVSSQEYDRDLSEMADIGITPLRLC